MELNVWILVMEWEDGSSARVFSTQPEAYEWLDAYVREQWDEGSMGDDEYPGDVEVARELYYETYEHENWTLNNQKVGFPNLVLPDDEVMLTSDECAAVCCMSTALAMDTVLEEGMSISRELGKQLLDSIYEKLKD